jgi:hypothetical protein
MQQALQSPLPDFISPLSGGIMKSALSLKGRGKVAGFSLLVFMAAPAFAADECAKHSNALDKYVTSQLTSCKVDSDCEISYMAADSCKAPYAVSKQWKTNEHWAMLVTLQEAVRKSCAAEWENREGCEPDDAPDKILCKNAHCVSIFSGGKAANSSSSDQE